MLCHSDVWEMDAQKYTWTLLSAGDPKFAPRERHGAVILKGWMRVSCCRPDGRVASLLMRNQEGGCCCSAAES